MENQLRKAIREQKGAVGTFLAVSTPEIVEAVSASGLNFVIIDTEHGTYDLSAVSDMVRASESKGMCPIVRVSDPSHREIQHALDFGAGAIIVPLLRDTEDFRKAAKMAKFPPRGTRGYAKGRGCCFGSEDWASGSMEAYMADADEKTLLIPQCETAEALENIEEIVRIDGIDGIFVGPFDLSICMGIPAQFSDPGFCAAVSRILKACREAGKISMIYTTSPEEARKYLEMGFDAVANDLDSAVFARVYREMVSAIRAA